MTGAGLLTALVAWLPLALKGLPLSLPIVGIGIGARPCQWVDVAAAVAILLIIRPVGG